VAGVRILSLVRKNGGHDEPFTYKTAENDAIISFLTKATTLSNVFGHYTDIDVYGDFFMTATAPEFRGQGLATEMYKRAIQLLKSKGVTVCKSVLTSPYTLKACQNLQFTELAKLYLKDHKDSNGICLFPKAGDLWVTVMAKRI
jgi:GNAT superfamily N-acetyltransferase